jgi:hypothetical protein
MDRLPRTWRQRLNELIDVKEGMDKNGKPFTRRSMRYGKINGKKMGIGDWDKIQRLNAWKPKKKKADRRGGGSLCRNGDDLCACLVLDSQCRLEKE